MSLLQNHLSYNGNIIEGIKVTFKDGQIVDITAEKGDQVMKDLVFENAGARALGECAWYQIQAQFLSQALPSSTPFSMKMRQITWLSVQPMQLALLVERDERRRSLKLRGLTVQMFTWTL